VVRRAYEKFAMPKVRECDRPPARGWCSAELHLDTPHQRAHLDDVEIRERRLRLRTSRPMNQGRFLPLSASS
jgi:hypothetical protein